MPSPTDFNLSPYYDDYTESKNFHRILFRPAFAVQARELTQSQSILQNQVERVSAHLFEKGAIDKKLSSNKIIDNKINNEQVIVMHSLLKKTNSTSNYLY